MRHNNFYGPLFERHAFLPKKRFMKDDSYDQLILSEVRSRSQIIPERRLTSTTELETYLSISDYDLINHSSDHHQS